MSEDKKETEIEPPMLVVFECGHAVKKQYNYDSKSKMTVKSQNIRIRISGKYFLTSEQMEELDQKVRDMIRDNKKKEQA